jgi:hypothetical protein
MGSSGLKKRKHQDGYKMARVCLCNSQTPAQAHARRHTQTHAHTIFHVSTHPHRHPHNIELQGANGAGKTTTFKVVTGEVDPDAGDAQVAGASVLLRRGAARRALGYCPQFDGLPSAMTGGERASACPPPCSPWCAQTLGRQQGQGAGREGGRERGRGAHLLIRAFSMIPRDTPAPTQSRKLPLASAGANVLARPLGCP